MTSVSKFLLPALLLMCAGAVLIFWNASRKLGHDSSGTSLHPFDTTGVESVDITPGPKTSFEQRVDDWVYLDTLDDRNLVLTLQGYGFPDRIVRAIIRERIAERYEARRIELQAGDGSRGAMFRRQSLDTMKALAQLNYERSAELEAAFNGHLIETPMERFHREQMFGQLPREKVERLKQIGLEYQELRIEAGYRQASMMEHSIIEKAMHEELATVLTPDEMEEYLYYQTRNGRSLQQGLGYVAIAPEERKEIFQAHEALVEATLGLTGSEQLLHRAEAGRKLQAVLGDDRYVNYLSNLGYADQLKPLLETQKVAITPGQVAEAYHLTLIYNAQVSSLNPRGSKLSPDLAQRSAEVRQQGEQEFRRLLGDEGWVEYVATQPYWLTYLR